MQFLKRARDFSQTFACRGSINKEEDPKLARHDYPVLKSIVLTYIHVQTRDKDGQCTPRLPSICTVGTGIEPPTRTHSSGLSVSPTDVTDEISDVEEQEWPAVEYHHEHGRDDDGNSVSSPEDVEDGATGGQYVGISDEGNNQRLTASPDASVAQNELTSLGGSTSGHYRTISACEEKIAKKGEQLENDQGMRLPGYCFSLRLPSKGDMLIYGGLLLNATTKGTVSCFETLGAEYAAIHFELTSAQVGENSNVRSRRMNISFKFLNLSEKPRQINISGQLVANRSTTFLDSTLNLHLLGRDPLRGVRSYRSGVPAVHAGALPVLQRCAAGLGRHFSDDRFVCNIRQDSVGTDRPPHFLLGLVSSLWDRVPYWPHRSE